MDPWNDLCNGKWNFELGKKKQQTDLAEHKPEFVGVQYLGLFIYISSCFQLLTLCSTSGKWTHVTGKKWWNNADMVGKNIKYLEKNPNQHNFSYHKSHSHWLGIEQFVDIYYRSRSRNRYTTIFYLISLIPTHVAVITDTITTSLFQSANTNLRMWSCTTANVRCCHSTVGNTATIC